MKACRRGSRGRGPIAGWVTGTGVFLVMTSERSPRIDHHFANLTDPRRAQVTYPLINIVTIALCATIAGADDFVAMADWARQHKDWLGRFLDLSHGIPSHDRFNMIFRRLNPAEFERCLLSWLDALHDASGGRLLAVDGKTARQSFDTATARSALHMVSVWAVSQELSIAQVAVDSKGNEITAIPEVLKLVELCGAVVTIDAMGCQAEIARAIVDGGGDYILAVKGNQPTLHDGIVEHVLEHMEDDFARADVSRHETKEKGHGRVEHRSYYVLDVPPGLPDAARWKGLKQIGVAVSDTIRDGKACDDVRYYILSKRLTARRFGTLVRSHWGIENSLHWQLDVSFDEDRNRTRKDHAAANLAVLRRIALSLLKNETSSKVGVKNRRLTAAWNTDYLHKVLFG
jgi:predicted transposase YbfD/YdcC